jgi:hypothetical protein
MMVDWLRQLLVDERKPKRDAEEVLVGAAAPEKAPA